MLSLNKLEKLLGESGLIINKIFVIDGLCIYLEILSSSNADIFLLYIPSRYDIKADNRNDIYKIKNIEFNDVNDIDNIDIVKEYGEEVDDKDIGNSYKEININNENNTEENIVKTLEDNYKKPILLNDSKKNDKKDIKDIIRQINRFKYCTQNIKYKIAIKYKNYISCIRRDDSIDCYMIKNYRGNPKYKLLIIVDLETYYTNMSSIVSDINTIQDGLYKIINDNHDTHLNTFIKLLKEEKDILNIIQDVHKKKQEYSEYIQKLEKMLENINETEKKIFKEIADVQTKYNNSVQNIHSDIEKSHMMAKYNTDLEKIATIKQDIMNNIMDIKLKKEDLFLHTDNFLFDNNVMMTTLLKNINKLLEYTK
jgi:hypothetical protein